MVALAELVSVCVVQIPEMSPQQRMSKTAGRDGPREKEKCGFPHPEFGASVVTWVWLKPGVKLEWLFCARGLFAVEMPSWKGQSTILFIVK